MTVDRITTTDQQLPLIHSNGSGGQRLCDQLRNALVAIEAAVAKLGEAAPHARDYYPLGDAAFLRASWQHRARMDRLRAVYDEVELLAHGILDGGHKVD